MIKDYPQKFIYIAGPLFSVAERAFLDYLVEEVSLKLGLDKQKHFFLPHRDCGGEEIIEPAGEQGNEIFHQDLIALRNAKIVIAWFDGQDVDSGTAFEVGVAFQRGTKIFGLLTDKRFFSKELEPKINLMLSNSCVVYPSINSLVGALKGYLG